MKAPSSPFDDQGAEAKFKAITRRLPTLNRRQNKAIYLGKCYRLKGSPQDFSFVGKKGRPRRGSQFSYHQGQHFLLKKHFDSTTQWFFGRQIQGAQSLPHLALKSGLKTIIWASLILMVLIALRYISAPRQLLWQQQGPSSIGQVSQTFVIDAKKRHLKFEAQATRPPSPFKLSLALTQAQSGRSWSAELKLSSANGQTHYLLQDVPPGEYYLSTTASHPYEWTVSLYGENFTANHVVWAWGLLGVGSLIFFLRVNHFTLGLLRLSGLTAIGLYFFFAFTSSNM